MGKLCYCNIRMYYGVKVQIQAKALKIWHGDSKVQNLADVTWLRTVFYLVCLLSFSHIHIVIETLLTSITHLQIFSALEEAGERILADMDLSFIHEFKECLHVVGRSGFQDNVASTRMTGWCCVKQFLEVFTACG